MNNEAEQEADLRDIEAIHERLLAARASLLAHLSQGVDRGALLSFMTTVNNAVAFFEQVLQKYPDDGKLLGYYEQAKAWAREFGS